MNDLVILIVIYAVVFISSPLIAILHELGHAFAYLIFTKPDKIDIYIGSYVYEKNPIHISVGKLDFYIKRPSPFIKGIGLCRSSIAETNYFKFIIILLAGPFFTLITAGILAIIAFDIDGHLLIKISCYIFLGLSAASLMVNLIPSEIDKLDKVKLDNDGKQILFALKIKHARVEYIEALQFLENKDYAHASLKLKKRN